MARKVLFGGLLAIALGSTSLATQPAHAAPGAARTAVRQTDLRPIFNRYRLTIKRQGARDTCHVFTVVAALEYAVARKYEYGLGLSEEYLNWAANQVADEWQDGASYFDLAQGLKRWGISQEDHMPYQSRYNPAYRPNPNALESAREIHKLNFRWHWIKPPDAERDIPNQLDDDDIKDMKAVLRKGWPVCAGREHNVLVVGFRDDAQQAGGGSFTVRNSNSSAYRSMTYADMKAKSNVALWIDLPLDAAKPE